MKKITLLLLLLILPGFMVGQNLLQEGGFEGMNTGTPTTPWTTGQATQTTVNNNSAVAHTGDKFLNFGNDFRNLRQSFTAEAGKQYSLKLWNQFVGGQGLPASSDGIYVSIRQNTGGNGTPFEPNIGFYIDPSAGNLNWTEFSLNFIAPQSDLMIYIFKQARVPNTNPNNSARMDDFSIRKLHNFTGGTNSDFATATNWDSNEIPVNDDIIIIPSGQNAELNGGFTLNGNLTIDSSGSLVINGGSSMILGSTGAINGNITYKRTLQGGKWHFVTPPVEGATYNDTWIADNGIASGQGDNRGISTYQNGTADPTTGQWLYVQAGSSGTFETSKGYSLRRTVTGDVSFTGTYPTGAKPATVSIGENAFNLVGNPYPTYLSIANFFVNNTAASSKLTEETVWIWDQSANAGSGGYVQKTSGIDGTFQIAPGQAFFINSGNASNIIFYQFNGTNQTDTFLKSEKTQAIVKVATNSVSSTTELYYLPEGTNDFDNGYDASKFTGVTTNFDIFTSQLSDGSKKLGRQVLSNSDIESLVIPIGVKAAAGQELTFTAEAMNFPDGIKLFLEDRTNNTIKRLDGANSEYKVTLSEALDGTGRFFLHTKSSAVLSTEDANLTNVSIFKTSNENLRIVGLTQRNASLKLFNILGKQVLDKNFQSKGTTDIALPKLATGVYVVQLQTENGRTNKKIILE